MKRFLSILVAVAMTISMVLPVFAASYTDTVANDYEAAIEHLSGLGVVNGYEDGSYQPEKVVTRAEMAKLLVVALGLDAGADILTGESEFADVAANHWAIGYINVATQYGLIKGDGDGNFRPDDTVNYAEVVTMALRALNYTTVVEKAGQWPTNYLNKANELKLFEDVVSFKASEGAKRGEVAQILWNTLNTQMWEVVSENEGNGLTSTANRTMLQVKFSDFVEITSVNPVVYSTNFVNEKTVEEVTIVDKDTIAVKFAGETELVYFEGVSPLVFVKGATYEVLYTEDKVEGIANKVNVAKSLYKDTELVVAGKVAKATEDEITIAGNKYQDGADYFDSADEGKVVVLNLDLDGKVKELVELETKANTDILVEEVKESKDGKTVRFEKYKNDANSDIVVDLDVKDQMFVKYNVNGDTEVIDIADVKAGMIVEIYKNSITNITGSSVVYLVSDATLTGKVDRIDELTTDTAYALTIDGIKYGITVSDVVLFEGDKEPETLSATKIEGLIGQTITAKLSTDGNIKYVEAEDEEINDNYAVLHSAWVDTDEGIDTEKIKVVTLAGEEKILAINTKYDAAVVDGKVLKVSGSTIAAGTVINYTLIDEEVTGITTENLALTSITKVNETAKIITIGGKEVAYDSSSKFVRFVQEEVSGKVVYKVSEFTAASITEVAEDKKDEVANKLYVAIVDDTTKVAEYLIYIAPTNAISAADKVYGVITKESAITGKEDSTSIWSVTVKDVLTGVETSYATNKGPSAECALKEGAVVEISEKANGFYSVVAFKDAITAVGKNARKVTVAASGKAEQIGTNYKVGAVLFANDAELVFIEDGEIVNIYGVDDINENDVIYAFDDIDETIGELYTTVIIEKVD